MLAYTSVLVLRFGSKSNNCYDQLTHKCVKFVVGTFIAYMEFWCSTYTLYLFGYVALYCDFYAPNAVHGDMYV